jgi:hypothetical protein
MIEPPSLTHALRQEISDAEIQRHFRELCEATRMTAEGPLPDWPNRAKGLQLLLSYREGLPLPRSEEPIIPKVNSSEVIDRIKTRPAYRQAFRDYLDFLDREDAKTQPESHSQSRVETGDDQLES